MNDDHNPSEGEDHPSDRQILYQELDRLVIEASQHPPDSFARKRYLSQIVIKIQNSGLIWSDRKNEPFYEDAVQEQWYFFCSNLCEARTGTQYDRTRSNPITWFNNRLNWRLLTLTLKRAKENQRICSDGQKLKDGKQIEIEHLPDRDESQILEYIQDFEEVKNWIETNPDGVLSEHIRGRPELTCQVILRRLSFGKTFTTIALEFGCPYPTIYSFYKNKCRHHLEVFRENHGY